MSDNRFPKVGMKTEQVRERLLKTYDTNRADKMKESMINQVKLHEGEGAAKEISKEVDQRLRPTHRNCDTNFTFLKTMTVANTMQICNNCKHDINRTQWGCPDCIPYNEYKTKYEPKES